MLWHSILIVLEYSSTMVLEYVQGQSRKRARRCTGQTTGKHQRSTDTTRVLTVLVPGSILSTRKGRRELDLPVCVYVLSTVIILPQRAEPKTRTHVHEDRRTGQYGEHQNRCWKTEPPQEWRATEVNPTRVRSNSSCVPRRNGSQIRTRVRTVIILPQRVLEYSSTRVRTPSRVHAAVRQLKKLVPARPLARWRRLWCRAYKIPDRF